MKKVLALLLCVLMCAGALVGCAQTGTESKESIGTLGDGASIKESKLPDIDWGGKELVIGEEISESEPSAAFSDDMTTAIGNVVFVRNTLLAEKYNFTISVEVDDNPSNVVRKDAMAGESTYDILIDTVTNMKGALADGVFYDLSMLKYVDLKAEGWNQSANKQLTIRNYQYVATGDLSLREKGGSYVIFCNKDKMEQISDIDIRQEVLDGNWTVEMMQNLVKKATVIDGSTGETSEYGLVNQNNHAFYNFLSTGYGVSICEKDDTDTPYYTFDDPSAYENVINAIDDLLKMYVGAGAYTPRYSSTTPQAIDVFTQGRSLFFASIIHNLTPIKDSGSFQYTVLPHPKYEADGTTDYYSAKHYNYCTLIAVPYFSADLDFSSFALQALSENSGTLTETYVEEQCKLKGSYDSVDYQLMTLALVDVTYDLGVVYNWGAVHVWIFTDRYDDASGIQSIPVGKVNNFATLWAADKALAHLELNEFLNNFTQ